MLRRHAEITPIYDENATLSREAKDKARQVRWWCGRWRAIFPDPPGGYSKPLEQMKDKELLQQLHENSKLSMLRNATWTLSNFCRGKPLPEFMTVRPALPTLAQLIYSPDEEVLTDACWALLPERRAEREDPGGGRSVWKGCSSTRVEEICSKWNCLPRSSRPACAAASSSC